MRRISDAGCYIRSQPYLFCSTPLDVTRGGRVASFRRAGRRISNAVVRILSDLIPCVVYGNFTLEQKVDLVISFLFQNILLKGELLTSNELLFFIALYGYYDFIGT